MIKSYNFLITLFSFLILSQTATAQKGTIYYDIDWNEISDKSSMQFYRKYERKAENLYTVRDYYKTGQVQMEGQMKVDDNSDKKTLFDNEERTGKFTYYFYNGEKESEGNYVNNERDGVWKDYYDYIGKVQFIRTYKDGFPVDGVDQYYKSGEIKTHYIYKDKKLEGRYERYFKNGVHSLECFYKKGKLDGIYKTFYKTGKLKSKRTFIKDSLVGDKELYYPNRKLKQLTKAEEGKLGETICYDKEGKVKDCEEVLNEPEYTTKIHTAVEQMPEPEYNIKKYFSEFMYYPKEGLVDQLEGRVVIKFVVDRDGSITNARCISPNQPEVLVKEALRVVSHMPAWIPGRQDGVPVKVYFTIPVSFRVPK